LKTTENESPRGKPRGIFKGKIHLIAASCGELNPKRDLKSCPLQKLLRKCILIITNYQPPVASDQEPANQINP